MRPAAFGTVDSKYTHTHARAHTESRGARKTGDASRRRPAPPLQATFSFPLSICHIPASDNRIAGRPTGRRDHGRDRGSGTEVVNRTTKFSARGASVRVRCSGSRSGRKKRGRCGGAGRSLGGGGGEGGGEGGLPWSNISVEVQMLVLGGAPVGSLRGITIALLVAWFTPHCGVPCRRGGGGNSQPGSKRISRSWLHNGH